MIRRRTCKDDVIRGQQEEIEAQNLLIEWLLRLVEKECNEAGAIDFQTLSEECR